MPPLAKVLSSLLAILLVASTSPSAMFLASSPQSEVALIGSLSAAGPVELRGVTVLRDGTVFSGDTIRTRENAYASVALRGGHQIELGSDTGVRVDARDDTVRVDMTAGQLAFASATASAASVNITVAPYEIVAAKGAAGDVVFLGERRLGVRAGAGSLMLRSLAGEDSIVLGEGEARVVALVDTAGEASQETGQLGLRILVVSGRDAENPVDEAAAEPLAVVVVDRDNLLIPGATVEFSAPETGPGGTFGNGSNTFETMTDDTGRAEASFAANAAEGGYFIEVQATFAGEVARAIIPQLNVGAGGAGAIIAITTAAAVGGGAGIYFATQRASDPRR